jgi:hypothetical protein
MKFFERSREGVGWVECLLRNPTWFRVVMLGFTKSVQSNQRNSREGVCELLLVIASASEAIQALLPP